MPNPRCVGLTTMRDPRYLDMINMSDLTNNKQRGQMCIVVVRIEKRKEKHKQSIIDGNPIIIYLHASYHVKEDMTALLVRHQMTRFSYP
jgi:hypothetical protein